MHPFLTYDDQYMRPLGVKDRKRLVQAHERVEAIRLDGKQGFFDLPYEDDGRKVLERMAKDVRARFDRLIVIGIGGSDLGARMLSQALAGNGVELIFVSNPDPDEVSAIMQAPKALWKRTAINVVSKSGTTLETMAIFMTLREALIKAVGTKSHAAHIFATTEPGGGTLYEIAQSEGYAVIPHPLNVGGRFSVLSSVGLFPAACAGIDVKRLLAGARWLEESRRKEGSESLSARFAGLQHLAYANGQPIHVLMPYSSLLTELAFWYRQLWAESLGKKNVGPTPIAAFGAIDQHSQIQLYNGGPVDKTVTFIEVASFASKVSVPRVWSKVPGVAYIGGMSFEKILHAERRGTAEALAKNERPNGTLHIPNISPETVGALVQFYMTATVYMAELLDVNAFDQPGVESGKIIAKQLLNPR